MELADPVEQVDLVELVEQVDQELEVQSRTFDQREQAICCRPT